MTLLGELLGRILQPCTACSEQNVLNFLSAMALFCLHEYAKIWMYHCFIDIK